MSVRCGVIALLCMSVGCADKDTGPLDTGERIDVDQDGSPASLDCDDDNADVLPGAPELCDGLDNDCDTLVDEEPTDPGTFYADSDADSYGDPAVSVTECEAPSGYVADNTDCDDTNPLINPATEWYADIDDDGYGDPTTTPITQCEDPGGAAPNADDCDDLDSTLNPETAWYPDTDGDGFGDDSAPTLQCEEPAGHLRTGGDCDDSDAFTYPEAAEICDNKANDCTLVSWDPSEETGTATWFDPDGQSIQDWSFTLGYGNASSLVAVTLSEGDLNLCPRTWYVKFTVSGSASVTGPQGAEITALSGGGSEQIFLDITGEAHLELTGLTLTDGSSSSHGGLALVHRITAVDSVFTDGRAAYGGCLHAEVLELDGSRVSDCVGTNNGGGVWSGEAVLIDSELSGNSSTGDGGGLFSSRGLWVTGSTVADNQASGSGGGLHSDTSLSFTNSTAEDNLAVEGGGLSAAQLTVDASIVDHNYASSSGGGLFSEALTVTESTISDNVAGLTGGGLYVQGDAALSASVVQDNRADYGAGASIDGNLTCSGTAGTVAGFFRNSADSVGGALSGYLVSGQSLESVMCDWGVGSDTNLPEDVYYYVAGGGWVPMGPYDYGDDVSFTCGGSGC